MRFSFRPQNNALYEFFTSAARNLNAGTQVLTELTVPDYDTASISERLVKIEHENDELTHRLYNTINSTFITPFDREDMYRLGARLDDVIDHIEAAATLIHLYGLTGDGGLPEEMHTQIEVLVQLGELTAGAFNTFAAKGQNMQPYLIETNRLENEGDRAHRMLLVRLFGGGYKALMVLKLKEVGEELEEATDAFEQVANTIESIIVKES